MSMTETDLTAEVLRPGDEGYDAAARVFFAAVGPPWWSGPATPPRSRRHCATPSATASLSRCARVATADWVTAPTPAES